MPNLSKVSLDVPVRTWHYFRQRKIPVINPILYYFTSFTAERVGFDRGLLCQLVEDDWSQTVLEKAAFEAGQNVLFEHIQSDPEFLDHALAEGHKIAVDWLFFCRNELNPSVLGKDSDLELMRKFSRFLRFYENFSCANVPPWMYAADRVHQQAVGGLASKVPADKRDSVAGILSTPTTLSYVRKFDQEMAQLFLDFESEFVKTKLPATLSDFKEFLHKCPPLAASLKKISDSYFWVPFDYLGPELWDEDHVARAFFELLALPENARRQKIHDLLYAPTELQEQQNQLARQFGLTSSDLAWFVALRKIAVLQDVKKRVTTEAHYFLQQLFKQVSRRKEIALQSLYLLLESDFNRLLVHGQDLSGEIASRKKICLVCLNAEKVTVYSGEDAARFARYNHLTLPSRALEIEKSSLSGQTANPGRAVGSARVLLSNEEIPSMKTGEILIATMTTPDYVAAMKKAAGIVTDEGGITCHAAIVSRELGIPCLIGTRSATRVFKTGDLVELDASRGVIRKQKFKEKKKVKKK